MVTIRYSLLSWIFLLSIVNCEYKPCQLREYQDGFVCVCNETYCDTMDVEKPERFGDFLTISSTKSGKRFEVNKGHFRPKPIEPNVIRVKRFLNSVRTKRNTTAKVESLTLTIDVHKTYQKIIGFGGAFTGSVSHLIDAMPESLRHSLYRNYYAQDEGIGYTLMRTPIGGCDFDLIPWAYNELPINDKQLLNFTELDHRDTRRNEQINDIKKVANIADIKIIGTAWSPPKWMKTNGEWSGRNALKAEFYQTWADYHLRYLNLMAAANMTLWGISTGNEPLNGKLWWFFVPFMTLGWKPGEMGKWVAENLGPSLAKDPKFHDIKLFTGDDQRYTWPWWFEDMNKATFDGKSALDYVSGFAVHWYWDRLVSPVLLDRTHEKFPDKILLNSESCIGDKPWEKHGPILGSWLRAEEYALGMIQDFDHHISGWIDWNLLLNEQGGPSYVNNTVDAAIVLNTTTKNEFYKQPIFYVLAHFSKFIPPDSVRVEANLNGFRAFTIKTVAFLCPDNRVTVILYNNSDKLRIIDFTDDVRGSFEFHLEPRSITTFIYA